MRTLDVKRRNDRCPHGWCSDCKTKRGRNVGNRWMRRTVRLALRRGAQ